MKELSLGRITWEGTQLLETVRSEFKKMGLDESQLPKSFLGDEKLKIVFIGQYSAGKSSTIKMLTGSDDIKIGSDITTQESASYEWNGIEIVDTPGIHTEIRQDHDEITYNQINHAALLVFCITNEGFSQNIGEHFRELAVNQKRGDNMILVVNKMDRAANGNTPAQQKIISDDLQKVTDPYSPEDLYISFISANSYLKAMDSDTKPAMKEYLIAKSGYDSFIENLNRFIEQHKMLAKVTKPLYIIADQLRYAALISSDSTTQDDLKAVKEILEHQKQMMINAKKLCRKIIDESVSNCKSELINQGQLVADSIQTEDQQTIDSQTSQVSKSAQRIVEKYADQIQIDIADVMQEAGDSLTMYAQSDFVQKINDDLQKKLSIPSNFKSQTIEKNLENVNSFAMPPMIMQAMEMFGGENAIMQKLGDIVGKSSADILLLLKNNLGKVGIGLGVIGAAVAAFAVYKNNQEADEKEKKILAEKKKFSLQFEALVDEICDTMRKNFNAWIKDSFDPVINSCDEKTSQLSSNFMKSKTDSKKLKELLSKTEFMIDSIQIEH